MLRFAMTVDTESNLQVKSVSSVLQVAITADTESDLQMQSGMKSMHLGFGKI